MRLVSLFVIAATVLMTCETVAEEPLFQDRDLLSRTALQSPDSEDQADDIGQMSVADSNLLGAETAGVASSLIVPDGVPDSVLPSSDPRFKDLEERFNKLSKKFEASTAPKKTTYPTFKITGFTQLDSAWYSQSEKNMKTVGDAQDGTGFRRARLAVQGRAAEFTAYQLEVDFANAGRPSFFDTYVEQENLPYLGAVRVGHFLQPFSVDALSGFRNLPFLERSLPFLAFVPFRRDGVMAHNLSEDERTGWAYSVFRTGGFNNAPLGDSRFATDFGDIGGYSFSTRVTHLPWMEENGKCFWQVGFSYDYSQLGANDATGSGASGNAGSPRPFYQARTGPEFGPLGLPENSTSFGNAANGTPFFVDTGKYEAHNFNLFGFETVYQDGPFSLQAEWMATVVDSVVGPVFYNGAYGEVMYRLTGEHREYEKKFGALKNPIPFNDFISVGRGADRGIHGWGAWEVAYRWSFVDLTNPASLNGHYYNSTTNTFTATSHAGNGTVNDSTLGVSWFLNSNTKIQANWIYAMLDNQAKGFSTANLFVTRVQVSF
ncbi:MAG: porin [Planctomycetaceae bacterium]|nr:porin [Planctomycetaceae bacterium]